MKLLIASEETANEGFGLPFESAEASLTINLEFFTTL
jgi:hypothetical protein